jgi:hypothetical protein
MNRILRGIRKSHKHSVGNRMNNIVHNACSDMLFNATLMAMTEESHVKMRFKTNAIPTTIANGLPPMTRKQSTQLTTVGYIRKNCSKT